MLAYQNQLAPLTWVARYGCGPLRTIECYRLAGYWIARGIIGAILLFLRLRQGDVHARLFLALLTLQDEINDWRRYLKSSAERIKKLKQYQMQPVHAAATFLMPSLTS